MGSFTVQDIWVNPQSGNDANSGTTRDTALKTLTAAWVKIPEATTFETTGYRIQITPGTLAQANIPNYFELKYGTYRYPVIIQSADGAGKVFLTSLNIAHCNYIYLINLNITKEAISGASDALHFEGCNYALVKGCDINGRGSDYCQEVFKANQCKYLYIEDNNMYGPCGDNVIDFVAVQYGHIMRNKLHNAADWVFYTKGGSAYLRIEGNEIYNSAGNGGYTAGQGTGFNYMVSPWIHYEAYNIKFVNNIIHDLPNGAGMGVGGGYNILMAYNTLYKIGSRNQLIEVVHGSRSPDENMPRIDALIAAGGWGVRSGDIQYIPAKHVYIYNNIVYNPAGFSGPSQHFQVDSTANMSTFSLDADVLANFGSSTTAVDDDLQIRNNVIWNPSGTSLGVGGDSNGGNASDVESRNLINVIEPKLVDPDHGDYTLITSLHTLEAATIPDFHWTDVPTRPLAPEPPSGMLSNTVNTNYSGSSRTYPGFPGAL
jgi:hypothetical protein